MSIFVKNFLWYTNDGSHYIHEKHRKRQVPIVSEAVSEGGMVDVLGQNLGQKVEPSRGAGPSGTREEGGVVDVQAIKTVVIEAMKSEISEMVRKTIREEIRSLQESMSKSLDDLGRQIKGNSDILLAEFRNFRLLYDEFSDRVKKDLNNNFTSLDRLIEQIRKVGELVKTWFSSFDSRTDKNIQSIKDLQGEFKLFLSKYFPDYVRQGAHIIDLDSSPEKPSASTPGAPTSTPKPKRQRRS